MDFTKEFLLKGINSETIFGSWLIFGEENKNLELILSAIPVELFKNNEVLILKDEDLNIESIRQVKHFLSLKPVISKTKFVIISEAHKLNLASQNAFLKIFEEPPDFACILLVTSKPTALLPTILSRSKELKINYCEKTGDKKTKEPGIYNLANKFIDADFKTKTEIISQMKQKRDWAYFYHFLLVILKNRLDKVLFGGKVNDVKQYLNLLKRISQLEASLFELNLNNRLQLEVAFLTNSQPIIIQK